MFHLDGEFLKDVAVHAAAALTLSQPRSLTQTFFFRIITVFDLTAVCMETNSLSYKTDQLVI